MAMTEKSSDTPKTLREIAQADGRYSEEAYKFVRDGLDHASRATHGQMTPAQSVVALYMGTEQIDLDEVMQRNERGVLDPVVAAAIKQAGGLDALNRNVSGQELSWGLRDYALRRWGLLASVVLRSWGIERTDDFGNIVFALVDHGFMQKEPHDSIADFQSVYRFEDAFDKSFGISL